MLHFQRLFEQAVVNPGWRLRDFSLLSGSERQQILVDWNNTSAPYPSTQTIPGCFATQVARSGDAIALRSPQGQLTYSELNQQSNRLAHRLRKSGIQSETPVAILMERSVQTVVATLAVLKGRRSLPAAASRISHGAHAPDHGRRVRPPYFSLTGPRQIVLSCCPRLKLLMPRTIPSCRKIITIPRSWSIQTSLRMLCTLRVPPGRRKGGRNPPQCCEPGIRPLLERRKSGSSAVSFFPCVRRVNLRNVGSAVARETGHHRAIA